MRFWFIPIPYLLVTIIVLGCGPSAEVNVAGYLLTKQLGTQNPTPVAEMPGTLTGRVIDSVTGEAIEGATVLVAEQTGRPHTGQTDAHGRYTIEAIPSGNYSPAAIAPGYLETASQTLWGTPGLVQIDSAKTSVASTLRLVPYRPTDLPENLAQVVGLTTTTVYTATAPYPDGSAALVHHYELTYHEVKIDSLRLYTPLEINVNIDSGSNENGTEEKEGETSPSKTELALPLLFMVYPTHVDLWETVSVAFAGQGYALVAMSPMVERGLDIDAHAQDARIGLELATRSELHPLVTDKDAVVLGGSFSSAVLNRLLRDASSQISAWVTVGGIGNAFTGTSEFYAGQVTIPAEYTYLIPALGSPRLYPLPFLRYSPVYAAPQLPPTQIIHTAADLIIPIEQAYELEQALRSSGVPVEVFYYDDVSHYLQIDENLTDAGKEMFTQILAFIEKYN
ncbi:MAG: carboxypeptidase regulatory-like domain-containing protein [Chloroflexota bacterium]